MGYTISKKLRLVKLSGLYGSNYFKLVVIIGMALLTLFDVTGLHAQKHKTDIQKPGYQIAVSDLMILKRQKIGSFELTKKIGADGVEVDMGSLGNRETFENKLADPLQRKAFLQKADSLHLQICSLAMTGFFAQSLATRATYQKMVGDCIATMQAMGVKIAFLPLGISCDLQKHPELTPVITERLKVIGGMAEKAGVIIGIETSLDAQNELKLLKSINSKSIRSYFNFANALDNGRDLSQQLRILGKYICQIHCTDTDGQLLENDPKINMEKVKKTLDDMRWKGWLVIERSRDARDPRNVLMNFGANTKYMKSIFQTK